MLTSDEARIDAAFQRVLARKPSAQEVAIVLRGLRRSAAQYSLDVKAADQLLSVGESARNQSIDIVRHAAWASACLTLLNMDETLNRE